MKKITSIFVTLAAAAMALVSCNRNELVPSAQGLHFTINASAPQTRTYLDNQLDGNYKVGWNANDEIAIFIGTIDEKTSKATAVFQNTAGKAERATFEGTAVAAGEGTFVSLYPASKFVKGYKNGTVGVELASTQQPSAESFDPLADILAAPACAYESDGTDVVIDDLYFKRVISVVKVNLKGTFAAGDVVKNFSMTSAGHFGEDGTTVVPDTLTGRASIDLAAQKIVKWNTNSNSVKAIPTEDIIVNDATANAIYLAVNPTTIVAGTEVTFEAETDKHAIKKTVTLSKDLAFPQGNIAVINLTITEADCSAIVDTDYSGDYLMTGTYTKDEVTATYAAKAWVSGNNNLKTAVVTVNADNTISASDSDHKMTFTKVTTGDYAGMYTIQDANGLYLYAASNSGNHLKGEAEPDVNAYWTVKANEDGTYAISAEKSSNRNVLEFNTNNGSPIISCYSSSDASRQSVKLYPYSAVTVPPVFTVEASGELNVNAAATSAKFAVTANVAWTASLEEAYEGVTIAPASGSASATVTLSFPANTTATAKEYIVYFNADGFPEFEFTVNQAAAAPAEAKTLPYTQDFKADGQGDFVIDNVNLPEGLTYVWTHDSRYGMKASAYVNPTAYASESWLISPLIDLTSATAPELTFRHATNQFSSIDVAKTEATVWIQKEGGNWEQLTINYPTSLSWTFVDGGPVDLTSYVGNKVKIAFKYTSTATKAGTWEVDKFSVAEETSVVTATVKFASASLSLKVGDTAENAATTNSTAAITYSSENPSIATVDANGKVTAVAVGSTNIIAKVEAVEGAFTAAEATCPVSVTAQDPAGTKTVTVKMQDYATAHNCTISSGTNVTVYKELALDDVITLSTTGEGNCGSFWYTTDTQWRLYQNKDGNVIVTAASGYELVSVKFIFVNDKSGALLDGTTTMSSGTEYPASGSSVTYTVGNTSTSVTNGQIRITDVEVKYKAK